MSNEILKFCENGTTSDLLTQAEYSADAQRLVGNQPGIARQKLVNKVLRQCAFISNAFAEYIATKTGSSVLDNNDSTALQAIITSAFTATYINPNIVINGNFNWWQRNTTFAVSTNNTYTADRWAILMTGSTSTVARQTVSAFTEPFNALYFLRSAVTSSAGVSNFNLLTQKIENVVGLAGKQITLSFYAKADSSRNMSVEFLQNFGTGGSPSADVNSLGINKLALTTSWQKFTITVTLPAINGKVLGSNDNSFTGVNFWFDAGANFNSRTSSLGQQSGTFDVAQVKVELGSNATAFTLSGASLEADFLNCQRFFTQSMPYGNFAGGSLNQQGQITSGTIPGGSSLYVSTTAVFPVIMRSTPTVQIYDLSSNSNRVGSFSAGGLVYIGNISVTSAQTSQKAMQVIALPGASTFMAFHYSADAEL
jgi:hypothetical protein